MMVGAGIEGETGILEHVGTSTRLVSRLEDGGFYSRRLQADCERQSAESGADNGSCFHVLARSGRQRMAARNGTGGRPLTILALSSAVSRGRIKTFHQRLTQAVKALQYPIALFRLSGAKQHAIQKPKETSALPG